MTDILARYRQSREEAVETAFSQPEKFDREYLKRYRETMLSEAKRGMLFLQESLSMLVVMRDRLQRGDLEAGELIYENIKITQECIRREMENISEMRGEL